MSTPAGWYPDPEHEGATRWWDGSAWAPSQVGATEQGATSDDASSPGTDASASRFDGRGGESASATVEVPRPSWATDASTPSWDAGQPSWQQPAAGQSASAPQQAGAQPTQQFSSPEFAQQGTYDQFSSQQFGQPRKSRTGLILALVGGGLLLVVIAAIVIGSLVLPNLLGGANQANQGPTDPADPAAPTGFPISVQLDIPADGQASNVVTITETSVYSITATSTNGEDGRMTLSGNGIELEDDDSGGELNPLIVTMLSPGDYTVTVEEYSGDPYTGTLTVDVAGEAQPEVNAFPATLDVSIEQDSAAVVPITVAEGGTYTISVISTNGEDPTIDLAMPDGQIEHDDDGGDGLDSLLTLSLEPGTYSLLVTEYSGDPLDVTVSISQG